MIGLDTNVLVRYIMQDDAAQAAKATAVVEKLSIGEPGFITVVSIVELVWVLTACFDLKREQIVEALDVILRSKQLVVDQADQVVRALRGYASGNADFADCLIERIASAAGCTHTLTFDISAAKTAGMALIQ